jgi:hypothetical protein
MSSLITDAKKGIDALTGYPELKFGLRGDGKSEDCQLVTVWAFVSSRTPGGGEQHRVRLPGASPLDNVRASVADAVGHAIEQPFVTDEAGFRFSKADLKSGLNTFSVKCQLRIDYNYSLASETIKSTVSWFSKDKKQ